MNSQAKGHGVELQASPQRLKSWHAGMGLFGGHMLRFRKGMTGKDGNAMAPVEVFEILASKAKRV